MDVNDPFKSKAICVNKCPEHDLATIADVQHFSRQTGSELCEYNVPVDDYTVVGKQSARGPCPLTPVNARYDICLVL